jgi:Na+(H+)/acetate symporter ActP
LSVGYFSGLQFVRHTDSNRPDGIEENYLGNEDTDDLTVMKFKKGEREMLTILHTHVLSISFIFFLLGGLVAITSLPKKLKAFLMIEPFVSIILTFGGIYLLWKGMLWMKWVVMISGILMTAVFVIAAVLVLFQLAKRK